MPIVRDKHIGDQFDTSRLNFIAYGRDGTQKFVDKVGNAIFVNRDGIVVDLYSKQVGNVVDELDAVPYPEPSWSNISDDERNDKNRRKKLFQDAWDVFLKSVPPLEDLDDSAQQTFADLAEDLEYGVIWPDENWGEQSSSLDTAHDSLEKVKEIYPQANITVILKLIANVASSS